MHKNTVRRFCSYLLILTSLALGWPSPAVAKEEALKMGVFPRRNFTTTIKMFTPLANHLSRKLGRKVLLETEKDFQSFWNKVQSGYYDIVHYNQYHYIRTRKKPGYRVIAKNEEFGLSTIAGSIVIRTDSHIKQIKDLFGKKIVFGGSKKAMQSYIIATYLLRRGGLKAGDYTETFAINPPNAVLATYFHQAAAAGVGDKVILMSVVSRNVNTKKLAYLARGQQLAHLPWAVSTRLPRKQRNRIRTVLTTLKKTREGKKILRAARLTNIVTAKDKEYDPHRRIIKIVTGEQY
ncbi:MAG TPA: hypothetical protein ENG78_03210 [Acidiferrobacteraceae bacterium]|nr:hypothetical protein [Acidiferrobacteraceae bacterium]HEX19812.1 hypothetical protein [Acidiferrobacteraceae bacterium]